MNKTSIQWTDFTVNPFRFRNRETGKVGHHCVKISPGCKNCYAGKMQTGPYLSGLSYIEENKAKGEFFLDEKVLEQILRRRKPARIFWCDMTDMFLEDYPDEWIDRCFAVMALTPHLTHQVLTKRSKRMREYLSFSPSKNFPNASAMYQRVLYAANELRFKRPTLCAIPISDPVSWPLRNVHLGVSVEDQQRKERIEDLRNMPAALRFLSLEPLLEDLGTLDLRGINWVIVGGESGPGARPCVLSCVRSIVAQCRGAAVKCFVKQLGANVIDGNDAGFDGHMPNSWPRDTEWVGFGGDYRGALVRVLLEDPKGGEPAEWPADVRVRELPA